MMTFYELTAKGSNKGGMSATAYFQAVEYHREALTGRMYAPTAWHGKGAEKLGLSGTVNFKDFEKLIDGFDPTTGEALTMNAGDDFRRPGWDSTFSLEKTVSIYHADPQTPADRKDLIMQIHNDAVAASLDYMETLVEVKQGKGGKHRKQVQGLVFSVINHAVSREGDPDIHAHAVLHNLGYTTDPDGTVRWNSIDPAVIKEHERALGAYYRAYVQWQLQQHTDLKLERVRELDAEGFETGEVYFRIAGMGDFARDHFSKRAAQIEDYKLEHAGVGRQAANLATRKDKDELAYPEQEKKWAEEFEDLRRREPQMMYQNEDLPNAKSNMQMPEHQPRTDEEILDASLEMHSFFTHGELMRQVAQEYGGFKSPEEILKHTNRIIKSMEVEYYDRDEHMLHRYSTVKMRNAEADIGKRALARLNDESVRIDQSFLDAAIERFTKEKGYRPSQEQLDAARHLAVTSGGTAVLSGYAGAGKTSGMLLTRMAYEDAGKTLLGVSTAWNASNKLSQDVGIDAVSSLSMLRDLENGKLKLTKDHVVVFDEGGMAGMHLAYIQKYVDEAQAKLLVLGDCRQLPPVTASNPMRLMQEAVGDAKLTDIRRQKLEKNKELSETWYGMNNPDGKPNGQQILQAMIANGHIKTADTDREAVRELVSAYFKDERPFEKKLVLGGTRAEVAGLNEAIRAGYRENGTLEGEDHKVRAIVNGEYRDLPIAVNERIRFSRRNDDLKVVNGDGGIVTGIKANEDGSGHLINVTLVSEINDRNGRELVVDTSKFKSFSYLYALTTHKSQGQGMEAVYAHVGERGACMMNNNLGMVSFTRHEWEYTLFAADSTLHGTVDEHGARHGGLAKKFEEISVKLTTQDVERVEQKPQYVETVQEPAQSITERLAAMKQQAIEQAREIEKQSIAVRAAAIVEMDRALQSEIGERDAVKAQVSALMKDLPAIMERQAQRPDDPIRKYIRDMNEWRNKIDEIDRERGGTIITADRDQEDAATRLLSRQPDPRDPPRPQLGKVLTEADSAPAAEVRPTVAEAMVEAVKPVVEQRPVPAPEQRSDEGPIRRHLRETSEWHDKIDVVDRERGGAIVAEVQAEDGSGKVLARVPDPNDPPRPVMPAWVPPSARKAESPEQVRRRMKLTQSDDAEAVFDLPQPVGIEVLVRPVRTLAFPDVPAVRAPAMTPEPVKPEVAKPEQKIDQPKLEQKDDGQRLKQAPVGPRLRKPGMQL